MSNMIQPQSPSVPAPTRRWACHAQPLGDEIGPLDFLRRLGGLANAHPRACFVHGERGIALAGVGAAAEVRADGPGRFAEVRARVAAVERRLPGGVPAHARPCWLGGFAFRADHRAGGVWPGFPAAHFFLPTFQLSGPAGARWLTVTTPLEPEETPDQAARRAAALAGDALDARAPDPAAAAAPRGPPRPQMDPAAGGTLFGPPPDRHRGGELAKVVLAQALRLRAGGGFDALGACGRLFGQYPGCTGFLLEPLPGGAFFGATPELLVRVDGRRLETVAMASSIHRGRTPEEDKALARQLLAHPKERHEHEVVVRSIRRRLEPLVGALELPPVPQVVRLSNIQHLKTPVRGTLAGGAGILPVVEALHPTPAMGGSPREAALAVIAREEPFERGWYAAPVGWLEGASDGLFVVAIRSAVSDGRTVQLFAGAGIVRDSDPDREWDEIQLKFRPLLDALGVCGAPG